MGMIKNSQITQSNKFAISLQCLKKDVRNGVIFDMINENFYKLVIHFLVEVARHVQNTQNREFVIFLQYRKENLLQLFCVLL